MPVPSLSVVLATRGRRSLLPRVLAPILDDPATAEVVVVVDGGDDGSTEWLEARAADEPRLVCLRAEGIGPGPARDLGARRAAGDLLLFVDDDVVLDPGVVGAHARRHAAATDPKLLVLGYMPVTLPPARVRGAFPTWAYAELYEHTCRVFDADPDAVLRGLWGGNLSLRRADLLAAGGFTGPVALRYHEDLDLGLRLARTGVRGAFERSLRGEHLHHKTQRDLVREARQQGRALAVVRTMHPDSGEVAGLHPAVGVGGLGRKLVEAARRPRAHAALTALVRAGLAPAGHARAWTLERRLGMLLGRLERRRGLAEGPR